MPLFLATDYNNCPEETKHDIMPYNSVITVNNEGKLFGIRKVRDYLEEPLSWEQLANIIKD